MSSAFEQLNTKLFVQAKERGIPISGTFELTSRCNMKCKMCYICNQVNDKFALKGERSAKEWIHLAEQARDAGMLYLLITGGEVFLRKDFRIIYEEIAQMGFNITIFTNGTMITPDIAEWLGRIPPSKIGVTIYGASADTYGRVCGYSDGFNSTINGVNLLLEQGIQLELRTTVIRDNVNDIDKLIDFAKQRKIEFGINSKLFPRREGDFTSPESERLSPREVAAFEIYTEKYFTHNTDNIDVTEPQTIESANSEQLLTLPNERITDTYFCDAGKCTFWVTWDGRMIMCADAVEPTTYPFTTGFIDAWEELKQECSKISGCNDCKKCEFREECITCPARLKSETGYYDKLAKYLCELMKQRQELRKEVT